MNKSAAAHIMTNEATRKYLHGLKRLLTAVQRLYPTDPSRSVEFISYAEPSKGAAGAGSMKFALLEAEARGDVTRLAPAPHHVAHDGSVKVPARLEHTLRQADGA